MPVAIIRRPAILKEGEGHVGAPQAGVLTPSPFEIAERLQLVVLHTQSTTPAERASIVASLYEGLTSMTEAARSALLADDQALTAYVSEALADEPEPHSTGSLTASLPPVRHEPLDVLQWTHGLTGEESLEAIYSRIAAHPAALAEVSANHLGTPIPLCARAQRSSLRLFRDRYSSVGHYCVVLREVLMQLCRETSSATEDVQVTWEAAIDGNVLALCKFPPGFQVEERTQLALTSRSQDTFSKFGRVTHSECGVTSVYVEDCTAVKLDGYPTVLIVTACPDVDVYARALEAVRRLDVEDECMDLPIRAKFLGLSSPLYDATPSRVVRARMVGGTSPLNAAQTEAVNASQGSFTLIRGPPGTGKSSVAACIVQSWIKGHTGAPATVVTAQQNKAVDRIAIELLKHGIKVCRVMAHQANVHPALAHVTLDALGTDSVEDREEANRLVKLRRLEGALPEKLHKRLLHLQRTARKATVEALASCDVVCCTCSASMDPRLAHLRFRNVLVDEATQVPEFELLMPCTMGACRVALVGDPAQLGPYIGNSGSVRERTGVGVSTFERLLRMGDRCYLLDTQYRMHPSISLHPAKEFYANQLGDAPDLSTSRKPFACSLWDVERPVTFVEVVGEEQTAHFTFFNSAEVAAIVAAVHTLVAAGYREEQITVITFYSGQVQALQAALSSTAALVGTVDSFQGQENAVVLLSCVRSLKISRFLRDYRRLCVAFTRAQCGLVVFGNSSCLKQNEWWERWLTHVAQNGLVLGSPQEEARVSANTRSQAAGLPSPPPSPPSSLIAIAPGHRPDAPLLHGVTVFLLAFRDDIIYVYMHDRLPQGPDGRVIVHAPAGMHEERDEGSLGTAVREVYEETGFKVPPGRLVESWSRTTDTSRGTLLLVDFVAILHSRAVPIVRCIEDHKHVNGRWLTVEEIDDMPNSQIFEHLKHRVTCAVQLAERMQAGALPDAGALGCSYLRLSFRRACLRASVWRMRALIARSAKFGTTRFDPRPFPGFEGPRAQPAPLVVHTKDGCGGCDLAARRTRSDVLAVTNLGMGVKEVHIHCHHCNGVFRREHTGACSCCGHTQEVNRLRRWWQSVLWLLTMIRLIICDFCRACCRSLRHREPQRGCVAPMDESGGRHPAKLLFLTPECSFEESRMAASVDGAKAQLCKSEISFLGFLVSPERAHPDPERAYELMDHLATPTPPPSPPPPEKAPIATPPPKDRVDRFRQQYAAIWGIDEPPSAEELTIGKAAPAFDRGRGVKRHVTVNVYLVQWRGTLIVHARDPTQLSPFQANESGSQARTFLPWFHGRVAGVWLKEAERRVYKLQPEVTFTSSARISAPLAGYGRCEYTHNVHVLRVPDDTRLAEPSTVKCGSSTVSASGLLPDDQFEPTAFTGGEEVRFEMGRLYSVSPDVFAAHLNATRRAALAHAVLEAFVGGERAVVRAVKVTSVDTAIIPHMIQRVQVHDIDCVATSLGKAVGIPCLRTHSECFTSLHFQGGVGAIVEQHDQIECLFTEVCRVLSMRPGWPELSSSVSHVSHEITEFFREHRHSLSVYYSLPSSVFQAMRRFNDVVSGHHVLNSGDTYLALTLAHEFYLQVYRGTKKVESRLNWDGPNRAVQRSSYLALGNIEPGWPLLWRRVSGVYQHVDFPDVAATHGESVWQGASLMDAEQIETAMYRLHRGRFGSIAKFRKFFKKRCWTPASRPIVCWAMEPILGVVEYASGTPLGIRLEPGARGVSNQEADLKPSLPTHAERAAVAILKRGEGDNASLPRVRQVQSKLERIVIKLEDWSSRCLLDSTDAPIADLSTFLTRYDFAAPSEEQLRQRWEEYTEAQPDLVLFYNADLDYGEFSNFHRHPPWLFEVPSWCNNLNVDSGPEPVLSFKVNTAEEALMACKAALMGDAKSFHAIAGKLAGPLRAKQIGQAVTPFSQTLWDDSKAHIGLYVVAVKAYRNPSFALKLFETTHRLIAEAAPRDRVWGIALDREHASATTPANWRGANLLGWVLMQHRSLMQADPPWPELSRV